MGEVQVGDRLEWIHSNEPVGARIVEWTGDRWIVISGSSAGCIFSKRKNLFNDRLWRFIGNFGKDNNFNVLYDLMNS